MNGKICNALKVGLLSVMLCVGCLDGHPALSYQKSGHFFSVYPIASSSKTLVDANERRLLAFCAQLPDQSKDLDAVAVYRRVLGHPIDWARWGSSNTADTEWVRSMISVQQLIHVLTGGNATDVQDFAKDTVQHLFNNVMHGSDADRRTNICALGVGMHMLGDAYAHQAMAEGSLVMYSTGMGHAKDFSYPDYPLCDGYYNGLHLFQTCNSVVRNECTASGKDSPTRFCRWMKYPVGAVPLLNGEGSAPLLSILAIDLQNAAPNSNDRNHWGEDDTEVTLLRDEKLPAEITAFFDSQPSSHYCQDVVSAAERDAQLQLAQPNPTVPFAALSCAKVWNAYAGTAIAEIAESEAKSRVIREHLPSIDWNKSYRCPLLDKQYGMSTDEKCN